MEFVRERVKATFLCAPICCACSPVCTHSLLHIYPLSSPLSLLRGAEQMGMHKAVKPQFGGGMRRFSCEEDNIYENIESELCFFTSQVASHLQFNYTSCEELALDLVLSSCFRSVRAL